MIVVKRWNTLIDGIEIMCKIYLNKQCIHLADSHELKKNVTSVCKWTMIDLNPCQYIFNVFFIFCIQAARPFAILI